VPKLGKYQFEIESILSQIQQFQDGNGTKKVADNLKHDFISLLDKIANDKEGTFEK
jgi:hypothetical protein